MQLESLIGHTFEVLLQIIAQLRRPQGIPPDNLLDSFFRARKYLGSNDRKFIAGNVYAALRFYYQAEHRVSYALKNFHGEIFEEDRLFLILMTTMSSESVSYSQWEPLCMKFLRGSHVRQYVPKLIEVLKHYEVPSFLNIIDEIALTYSYPHWMVERFLSQYGEDGTRKLCAALNEPAPITIRVNTLKTTVEQCRERLLSEGVYTERTQYTPHGLYLMKRISAFSLQTFRDGWFEVQDEGSQLVAYCVNPKPTEKVLDACAGAGGKTLAFAALMENRGEIIATDINPIRLQELRKRARRAGVHNVRIIEINTLEELHGTFREYFSIVFVDAPCTGLGTIRRNPGLKLSVTPETVIEVQEKQRAILTAVAPLVRVNGVLVYATCSILKEENENQIGWFIERNRNFVPHSPTVSRLCATLQSISDTSHYLLLPHIHATDGFYIAWMRRVR
ncbi:MAG: class I SAM-dependent methyltransferase [Bacteroidetes bacterium]|nr:class I SAM-dependent methyltransferase [Bacteroidota bacterium]